MLFGERRPAAMSLLAIVVGLGSMLVAATFAGSESLAEEAPLEISRFTIDGGGYMLHTGSGFELSGSTGQPDAGVLTGAGGLTLTGGFWIGQAPGDSNEDGGINLLDYVELNTCASGPGSGFVDPSCACFDVDDDHDVDLADVAEFQRTFSGF